MAWTPENEAEYQRLGTQLGILGRPQAPAPPQGLLGYSAEAAANILPEATEHVVQGTQSLLGFEPNQLSEIPKFFDQAAPQGLGQNAVRIGANLAGYLPAIALPEAGVGEGIEALGGAARLAELAKAGGTMGTEAAAKLTALQQGSKVAGMAAGFAFASTPEGPEATATQGAVGAIQGVAQHLGWQGKLAAGALVGGIGYYEGQKESPQQGVTMGLLNAAGPTLIDPAMHYIFGANNNAKVAGKAQESSSPGSNRTQTSTPLDPNFTVGQGTDPQYIGQNFQMKFPLDIGGGQPIIGQETTPQRGPLAQAPQEVFPRPIPSQPQVGGLLGSGMQVSSPTQKVFPRQVPLRIGGDDPALTQDAPRIQNGQLALPTPSEGVASLQDQSQPNFLLGESRGPIQGSPEQPNLLGASQSKQDIKVALEMNDGKVYSIPSEVGSMHAQVLLEHNLDPDQVKSSGFIYNGEYKPGNLIRDSSGNVTDVKSSPIPDWMKEDVDKQPKGFQGITDVEKQAVEKAKVKASRIQAPEGAAVPQPTQEGTHVMSSAVKQGNKILVGSEPFAPHEQIGLEHGLTDGTASSSVPEENRGFLVQNQDGSQGFANRKRAGKIAYQAKQISEPIDQLKSESMRQSGAMTDVNTPKAGSSHVLYSDEGLPDIADVHQVTSDGIVHYDHTDLITGETSQKVATLQEFDELQKHPKMRDKANITKPQFETAEAPPNPQQPVEPAAPSASVSQVKIKGRFGLETANVISKEGDTLHVEVDDPIFGKRRTSVLASDTLPMESAKGTKVEGEGTVPFKDVESAKLSGKEGVKGIAQVGESEADLRGSQEGTPKYKSMWIDRHGNIHGDMGEAAHEKILIKNGLEKPGEYTKYDYEGVYGKGYIRGVVHDNDHFTLDQTPWNEMSPPQRKVATEFAQDHGLKLIVEDKNAYSRDIADYRTRESIEQGPGTTIRTLRGKATTSVSLAEGLKSLNAEAANLIGNIVARLQKGLGRDIDTVAFRDPHAPIGAAFEKSGKVGVNLQWVNRITRDWPNMSSDSQAKAVMRVAALMGHEITHVAQIYGENSGLAIGGKPLLNAVHELVQGMSQAQREFVASSIQKNKGLISPQLNKYLAGDQDAVFNHYNKLRPGITKVESSKLAAGELLAEIGSVELAKRMEVTGLPTQLRGLINKFKSVIVNAVNWFRSSGDQSGVASLQSLSDISNKMFDHFAAADTTDLAKAFPQSSTWTTPPEANPFSSGKLPPNQVSVTSQPYLKGELARLGIRAVVGAGVGGIVGPRVSDNQMTTAEGMILGGVMGAFGPAVAKHLLSKDLAQEVGAAFKGAGGNPLRAFATLLGGGKDLRTLGLEGQFGDIGRASAAAKAIRWAEVHLKVNFDPVIQGIAQMGRGEMGEVQAAVQDAMNKVRFMTPGPVMIDAAGEYIKGAISKDQFLGLLNTDEEKQFANYITTLREGTTTLSKMYATGLPASTLKNQVINSSDTYISKFYTAYTEGKFNMEAFEKVKQDLMTAYPNHYDAQSADVYLKQHMQDIVANRELFGNRRSGSGEKLDAGLAFRRLATEQEIEAQQEVVAGLEHDPNGTAYKNEKGKLDWMQSHQITDNWAQWLGEEKDPVKRLQYTFAKVYPSAVSGSIIDMLDHSKSSQGLNFAYGAPELKQVRELMQHTIGKNGDPIEVARLQNQLKELSGYAPLPNTPSMGKLAGKYVSRFVRDELNTYETPYKWMDQPIVRSIASFNNLIKIADAPLNPITLIRNIWQTPLFALMARTKAGDLGRAYNILKNNTEPEMLSLMRRRGILGANYVASEIRRGPGSILSGDFDSDTATRLAKAGMEKIFEAYQMPDDLLRMGSFLSGLRRFGGQMSEASSGAMAVEDAMKHPDTIAKAAEYTERFTPNYDAVPRIIKAGRQLPFVSLYLSYTSEITKILKNLTVDAIGKDTEIGQRMHAITTLAGTVAIPAMMVGAAESNLSPQDRKEWDQVKKLGPDYTRSRFRLPLYRDKAGAFHYLDITNMLPADDYSQMMKAAANGDWKSAAAANPVASLQNTPLLNIVSEQVTGQDLDTGRTLTGVGGRLTSVLKSILPPIIPPGYEGERLTRAFSTTDTGTTGITNLESGVQYRPSDIIANYLTGMKWGNVTLSTVQRQTIEDTQQKIADQQRILRDTTNTNVNQGAKQNAINHYSNVVMELMKELTTKLQP